MSLGGSRGGASPRSVNLARMRSNGVLVTGGIIGILRGISGAVLGLAALSSIAARPTAAPLVIFELLLAFGILAISIFALVTGNDPSRSGQIRLGGLAIVGGGSVDGVLILLLFRDVDGAAASALGAMLAPAIIGALLVIGAGRLGAAAISADDD